jgi:uncharacterized protein YndB with AHSA1/START domain
VTRALLLLAGALATVVVVVLAVGWSLPVHHRASRSVRLAAQPNAIYALVVGIEAYPSWRSGVKTVEVLARDAAGAPVRFREHGSDGDILFEVTERVPDRRLVTRIADPSLPFGGQWTFEIAPAAGGTELRITEDGEVYNPIFRLASRFVMGHSHSIDRYLGDAKRALEGGK